MYGQQNSKSIRVCRKSGQVDFSLKIGCIGSKKLGCYYLQYVVCLKSSVNGTRKQTKQKTQNKLTLLAFKIIAILHNTLLATFIKLPAGVRSGEYVRKVAVHLGYGT
jgi:hypothetical protein